MGTTAIRSSSPLTESDTVMPANTALYGYMRKLSARLAKVRVANGDWQRVLAPSVCQALYPNRPQLTGVFLDPPYSLGVGRKKVYGKHETEVSADCREWAIEHGDNPHLRIVLAGYNDEHSMPPGWRIYRWKAGGGYGNHANNRARDNAARECLWFSPHCLQPPETLPLWDSL